MGELFCRALITFNGNIKKSPVQEGSATHGTAEGSISLVDTLKLHGGPENRGEKLAGQRDVHNAVLCNTEYFLFIRFCLTNFFAWLIMSPF